MIFHVVKKLGCSQLIGKTIVLGILGKLTGPAGWALLGLDVATTVAGAVTGGVGAFIKKLYKWDLNQQLKN